MIDTRVNEPLTSKKYPKDKSYAEIFLFLKTYFVNIEKDEQITGIVIDTITGMQIGKGFTGSAFT